MPENNQILSVEGQLVGMPLAGPESFSQQQLYYLKRALGVDETVLWEGTAYDAGTALTMSENCTNFNSLKIYGYAHEAGQRKGIVLAWPYTIDTEIGVTLIFSTVAYSTRLKITTGGNMSVLDHVNYWKSGNAFAFGDDGVAITKIVGIGRKESA